MFKIKKITLYAFFLIIIISFVFALASMQFTGQTPSDGATTSNTFVEINI